MIGGVSPVFRNFAASTGRLAGLRDMGRDVARTRVRMRPGRRLEAPTAAEVLPLCCDDAMPPSCCAIPPPGGRNGAAVPGCRNVAPPLRPAAVMRCRRHALPSLRRVGGMALLFRVAGAWPLRRRQAAVMPCLRHAVPFLHRAGGTALLFRAAEAWPLRRRQAAVMPCLRHAVPSPRRSGGMALLFRAAGAWPLRRAMLPLGPAATMPCDPAAAPPLCRPVP